jgi:transcriptional regulatory protein GAL4
MQDETEEQTAGFLGLSEQACNECRRRKAKCDRVLPECGLCLRHRRHCLYEQHSRTPLTRKHLTEVEERLRRAEFRAREAEKRASALIADAKANQSNVLPGQFAPVQSSTPSQVLASVEEQFNFNQPISVTSAPKAGNDDAGTEQTVSFEEPPPNATDDFSWSERFSPSNYADVGRGSVGSEDVDEGRVADGMASLTVEDEGGYLGSASGAAMLRLLLPDAEIKRRTQARRQTASSQQMITQEPGHDGAIPTPLYEQLRIKTIDMDAAIDEYFKTYHLSYPLIHEPTFRAQYSCIIPRPAGSAWNALAYMVAAIGAWTSTAAPDNSDVRLFLAAKSNLSIDLLETGNITLVQVLILTSNYVQKSGKPNSGYNYLGLAMHMAQSLGLHKGFKNWNLPLLTQEIRRRVWWCLHCFYSGACVTFGRPLLWPRRESPLPLNVHDRVSDNVWNDPELELT